MPSTIAENRLLSLRRIPHDRADHRHVGVFDAAAQRVRHHLLGDHADKLRRIAQQRLPQSGRARRPAGHRTASTDASIGVPPSPPCLVRHLPSASKLSSAKPIGSMSLWQPAHGSFFRCSVICSRSVRILPAPPAVSSSGGTFGGGSGGGVPRMFSSTHTPRLTGDVLKFCVQVTDRKLPLPEQSATVVQSPARASRGGIAIRRYWGCRSAWRAAR